MAQPRDREQDLNIYFPSRKWDGHLQEEPRARPFTPIRDVNYDIKSLDYTTPTSRARIFLEKMSAFFGANPFVVIDANAGSIGGVTLTFLESPQVNFVVSYEQNPVYANMLRRNIKSYGLGSRSLVLGQSFDETQHNLIGQFFTGAALFFDPPFLDESVNPAGNNKDKYLNGGIKMGNLTLEDHLFQLQNIIFVCAIHVPPNYKMNLERIRAGGWSCGTLDKKECPLPIIKRDGTHQVDFFVFHNERLGTLATANYFGWGAFFNYVTVTDPGYQKQFTNNWIDPEQAQVNTLIAKAALQAAARVPPPVTIILDESGLQPKTKPILPTEGSGGLELPSFEDFKDTQQQYTSKQKAPVNLVPGTRIGNGSEKKMPVLPSAGGTGGKFVAKPEIKTAELLPPYVEPGKDWVSFTRRLPSYTGTQPGQLEWVKEFQAYIYLFLRGFITDDDICKQLVNVSSMKKWMQAFTHETYNPKYNYETMETLGDSILGTAFKKFLYRTYPGMSPNDITNYTHHYLAKTYMGSVLGRSLKIHTWALVGKGTNVNISVVEDITEAVFGTLDDLCDTIKDGLGSLIAYKLVSLHFSSVTLDPEVAKGPKRTILDQYSSRLGLPPKGIFPRSRKTGEPGNRAYLVEFIYSDEMGRYFKEHNINAPEVLGAGYGANNRIATGRAVTNAIAKLNELGFTNEFVTEQANNTSVPKFLNDSVKSNQLIEKMKAKTGSNRASFQVSKQGDIFTVKLVGMDANNKEFVLGTQTGTDERALKNSLVDTYLQS